MLQNIEFPKELNSLMSSKEVSSQKSRRPWVTLSYAQSLDGSIATQRSAPLALSDAATLRITHGLRSKHSAILVGIGTLLADDPQLNVRLVTGSDPQPVVLDRQLRFPLDARLMRGQKSPWIFTNNKAQPEREANLTKAGVRVFRSNNEMHSIGDILSVLDREGMSSVMVEGGAGVITSFLQAQLVDLIVLTIAPRLVGGVRGIENLLANDGPHLDKFGVQRFDDDLLVWGCPRWNEEI
jgi:3,4-dihydroxy 2-butanone 4-phosphate synthase/GTP cyclohydrolase II